MKKVSLSWGYKLFLAFLFSCLQVVLWAQDNPTDNTQTTKTTTTTTETWYTAPWVWIVGGAVFLIILIALLRGSSSTNSETRTTVIKDNT